MMKVVSYNQHYLPDSVWERIEPYLPKRIRTSTRGRPACDLRKTIEGILWVLKSGARWRDLPDEYPSDTTCWRKLKELEGAGRNLGETLAVVSGDAQKGAATGD
ncbi:MAG: transposase [bacterium]